MTERTSEDDVDSGNVNTQTIQGSADPSIRTRDWRLFNVVLLGVTFLLLFTAFFSCSMVEVSDVVFCDIYRLMIFYSERRRKTSILLPHIIISPVWVL